MPTIPHLWAISMLMMEIRLTYFDNQYRTCQSQWLVGGKQALNVKKTKYMFFRKCKKTSLDFSPRLTISGTNIERVKDFNFLGLISNENLSWNLHIEFISKCIAKCIGIMNRLKRFLPPHILKPYISPLSTRIWIIHYWPWGSIAEELNYFKRKSFELSLLANIMPILNHSWRH